MVYTKLVVLRFKIFELKTLYPKRFYSNRNFSFGKLFSIDFDLSNSKVEIKDDVSFRNFCSIRSANEGKLQIGEHVFFNSGCSITCLFEITIGNNCQFGEDVKLYDHNHSHKNRILNINEQGYSYGSIKIGNNCWVGSNVVILKDVEIGDNVIIGAGCVIYKSVPANTTVVNNQTLVFK